MCTVSPLPASALRLATVTRCSMTVVGPDGPSAPPPPPPPRSVSVLKPPPAADGHQAASCAARGSDGLTSTADEPMVDSERPPKSASLTPLSASTSPTLNSALALSSHSVHWMLAPVSSAMVTSRLVSSLPALDMMLATSATADSTPMTSIILPGATSDSASILAKLYTALRMRASSSHSMMTAFSSKDSSWSFLTLVYCVLATLTRPLEKRYTRPAASML